MAAALASASETPRIALAPSAALFGVPSSAQSAASSASWSLASRPDSSSKMSWFTAATAFSTPLPR